jgi:hypothetical protein
MSIFSFSYCLISSLASMYDIGLRNFARGILGPNGEHLCHIHFNILRYMLIFCSRQAIFLDLKVRLRPFDPETCFMPIIHRVSIRESLNPANIFVHKTPNDLSIFLTILLSPLLFVISIVKCT